MGIIRIIEHAANYPMLVAMGLDGPDRDREFDGICRAAFGACLDDIPVTTFEKLPKVSLRCAKSTAWDCGYDICDDRRLLLPDWEGFLLLAVAHKQGVVPVTGQEFDQMLQMGAWRPKQPSTQRIGHVKFFCSKRGFGFITPARGEDVFFHRTAVEEAGIRIPEQGDAIRFDVKSHRGRDQAIDLKLVSPIETVIEEAGGSRRLALQRLYKSAVV